MKATLKRLAREYGKTKKQARGLTSDALPAVKITARIQRIHQGKRRSRSTPAIRRSQLALGLELPAILVAPAVTPAANLCKITH